jgi:hypothetical protein
MLTGLAFGSFLSYDQWQSTKLGGPDAPDSTPIADVVDATEPKADPAPTTPVTDSGALPEQLNIEVPFYTQAPTGNWDYPWQDACEEASVALIANVYLNKNWTRDEFNAELLALVDWQGKNDMDYHDTTVAETAEFMKVNYGLESIVHENPTFENIQKILADGHLIIGGFAGKQLYNPNFTNGGPIYHMLVIKGYDSAKQQIVTNDVGTRNGADYVYSWTVMENALHDWNPTDINAGAKLILEVLPIEL